jgi:hypothetical protein
LELGAQGFDVRRIFADQYGSADSLNEMLGGEMVFSAPARSAGHLTEANDFLVGVDLNQQKGRGCVSSPRGPDDELGSKWNPNRNRFNTCNLQVSASEWIFNLN